MPKKASNIPEDLKEKLDYYKRSEMQTELVNAFYTEEERREREVLRAKMAEQLSKAEQARKDREKAQEKGDDKAVNHAPLIMAIILADLKQIEDKIAELETTVERRYQAHFNGDGQAILKDVQYILDLVYPSDYEDYRKGFLRQLKESQSINADKDGIASLERLSQRTKENCRFYLFSKIRVQTEAVRRDQETADAIKKLLDTKAVEIMEAVADLPEDTKQLYPVLVGLRPEFHTMLNHNLINELSRPEGIIANDYFDLAVRRESGKLSALTAYTMVAYEENGEKPDNYKMDEGTRQVQDAIISLYLEAKRRGLSELIINEDLVAKAMPGGATRVSPTRREEIRQAIEKLRSTRITVVAPAEIIVDGEPIEEETWTLNNYCISALELTVTVKHGGVRAHGYKINEEPLMLTYGIKTGQMITIPSEYLDIRKVDKQGNITPVLVAMTAKRQAITGYLLRRIGTMNRDAKQAREAKQKDDSRKRKNHKTDQQKPQEDFRKYEKSRCILLDTLFNAVGLEDQSSNDAMDNRKFIEEVLRYQVAVGNIKGYEMLKEGRRYSKIHIDLEADEPTEKKSDGQEEKQDS